MLLPGYDVRKAAQAVAFFALKAGGRINVLKLSKLMYLAEREFMQRYDEPMFFDRLVSMPDGPVASITLNLMNGNVEDDRWAQFVTRREGYDIGAANGLCEESLDDLSTVEKQTLDSLWERFGNMNKYQLRDWTHEKKNIPEWVDPQGSSKRIHHEDVFRHLEKEDSVLLAEDIEEYRRLKEYINISDNN